MPEKIKIKVTRKTLKYGDLFSGIGCVAQALWGLGIPFEYKFACDIDKHCKDNLLHNFHVDQFYDDVQTITQLPKVDLFTAGFPCQPFSTLNSTKKGDKHEKHDLFTDTIRCLELCDPEVFILENVAGLTYKNNREYFNYIKSKLNGLKQYTWKLKLMNSKDYGTPQSRNRVYFVGRKHGIPAFPEPEPILDPLWSFINTELPLKVFDSKSKHREWKKLPGNTLFIDNCQSSGQFWKCYQLDGREYSYCLSSCPPHIYQIRDGVLYRRSITEDEACQLQRIHPHFENVCSPRQFIKQIGNGMDVSMMEKLIDLNVRL